MTSTKHGAAIRDLFIMGAFAIFMFAIITYDNVSETVFDLLQRRNENLADEFALTAIALVFALIVFSLRRWKELRQELVQRTRTTEALEASESELRALFAGITDVIFVLDTEGRFLSLAPTDSTHLHGLAARMIGKDLHEVFPKEKADYFLENIRRALRDDRMHRLEYSLQIDGAETSFEGSISPLSKDSVMWIARDTTEQREAAQALIKTEDRLQQSQNMEAMGTLAGGV